MGLAELFARIGDENLVFQNLIGDLTNAQSSKRGTLLTFGTNQITPTDIALGHGEKIAFVVWFSRERYERALAEHKAGVDIPRKV